MVKVFVNSLCLNEKEYIAKVVFEQWLKVPFVINGDLPRDCHEWRIVYKDAVVVFPDVFFAEIFSKSTMHFAKLIKELRAFKNNYDSFDLIGPYARSGPNYDTEIDLFGSAFFFISRFEDMYSSDRDSYGRVRESSLFLVRNNLERERIVDVYIEYIALKLGLNNKRAARDTQLIDVSFDVDFVRKLHNAASISKSLAGDLLKRFSLVRVLEGVKAVLKLGPDPYDKVEEAIFLVKKFAGRSTAYFMALEKGEEDFRYSLSSREVARWLYHFKHGGFAIGYHPSRKAATDEAQFVLELERLRHITGEKIAGSRQHYLCFSPNKTIDLLESNEIYEDTSTGFSRYIGYRTGTSFSYSLYSYSSGKMSSVITKPFQIMDVALLSLHENGVDVEQALFDVCSQQNQSGAPISIVWHPHNIGAYEFCSRKLDLKHVLSSIHGGMKQNEIN